MKKMLTIFICLLFLVTGCSNDSTKKAPEKTPEGYSNVHPMVQNMAFQEQDDGWLYYMSIQYFKTDQESATTKDNYDKTKPIPNFDGINLTSKFV